MRLLCPHSEKELLLPYSGVETQDYSRLCTKRGLQLRVSYNIDPVFFKFNNDDVKQVALVMTRYMSRDHAQGPDLNTIEGVVLQTYVSKLGLEVAWQDEEGRWGSRD